MAKTFDMQALRKLERERHPEKFAPKRRKPTGPFSTAAVLASIREAGKR